MISTTIDMIRHGEPVGGRKYRGQIDDPLSEKGWRQMREAVGRHCPWDAIVSSPLLRCGAFAAELAKQNVIALAYDARLKEIGFGEWEGKTAEALMEEDPDILMRFWNDPLNNTPPGAETLIEFQSRITAAWRSILEENAGRHTLIVGHAGQMRMVIRHVLEMPLDRMFRIQVPNAGITRIRVDGLGDEALPRLMFHGQSLPG
ncbi:histidine phosphatase family protein [Thiohalomonas denitrificans]|uniref:Probable phosphoglycerate mutase n=1 Tax=Thiohalomonas denitrificans TaxID=415747 RepID=A0A1G5Q6W7_9GAMM|nr:alpha-ribazole phosphatase family protein [Thiohalomonas denitrificans]SCZ57368.1 probable phosphoglycerate mutase [Thiohalomonas denitrificans]